MADLCIDAIKALANKANGKMLVIYFDNDQYFHTRDLSIDDLVCTCDLLKISCDACYEDFCLYLCPLQNEPKERGGEK